MLFRGREIRKTAVAFVICIMSTQFPISFVRADLPDLEQPSQNYFVESILGGIYHHKPLGNYREYRRDGLLTKGVSRFLDNPNFCFVGASGQTELREELRGILTDAVVTVHAHGSF